MHVTERTERRVSAGQSAVKRSQPQTDAQERSGMRWLESSGGVGTRFEAPCILGELLVRHDGDHVHMDVHERDLRLNELLVVRARDDLMLASCGHRAVEARELRVSSHSQSLRTHNNRGFARNYCARERVWRGAQGRQRKDWRTGLVGFT